MIAAIVMMIVLGAVLGLGLGIADKYLKVEVDERVEKVTEMLPNYNCGGCGRGEGWVSGGMDTWCCRPCKPERRQEVVYYLNSRPGPDGTCVHVKMMK